jgi:diketogulonate reductase-like aldo/keto reductase
MQNIQLNNQQTIPSIGFGTWMIEDEDTCISAVKKALDVGYRHIDTAQIYGNESFIGQAVKESNIAREDIFLTTKLWNDNQFFDDVVPSFEKSLKNLQTDYVDLFLIHFPVTELRRPAWRKMEELCKSGAVKSIGVSNYTVKHLKELMAESEIKPVVNQVELHVFLQQPELVEYCQENNIILEAYSPLAHGNKLDNVTLTDLAKKYNKTSAQIMLRWCVQKGFVVLPKSVTLSRIEENFEVFNFEINDSDMTKLASLNNNYRTCWDPTNVS